MLSAARAPSGLSATAMASARRHWAGVTSLVDRAGQPEGGTRRSPPVGRLERKIMLCPLWAVTARPVGQAQKR